MSSNSYVTLPNELLMEILSHISLKERHRMNRLVPELKRFRNDAYFVFYTHTMDLEYLKSQRTSQNVHYVDLGEKFNPRDMMSYDIMLVYRQLTQLRRALETKGHSSLTLQFLFGCDDSSVYHDMEIYPFFTSHFEGIPHHVEVVKRNMAMANLTKNLDRNIGLLEYNYSTATLFDPESMMFTVDAQEPLYSMFASSISKNYERGSMFFNRSHSLYEKHQFLSVSREESDLLDVSVLLVNPEEPAQGQANISETFLDRLYGDGPVTERQAGEIKSIKEIFSEGNTSKLCELLIPHFGRLITELDHLQTKQTVHDYLHRIFKMKDHPQNCSFLRYFYLQRKQRKDNGIYPAPTVSLSEWFMANTDGLERCSRFWNTFDCFDLGLAPNSDYDTLSKLVDQMLFAFKHSQMSSVPIAAVRINVLHDSSDLSVADKERNDMICHTTEFNLCETGGSTDINGVSGRFMG
ncbi:hypothetical protein WICPIJ_001518 [Wickerhamomyces pijperi]|uniref:F-box domain-containing protein n=1 Tax=Wickerhamomyces pijperi TaxID=599730 RepID=A0A9P8QBF5_WICPI|nr:hypothetical protein WICPIJ_001518 [Wickerhamomyces pijperi]